MSESLTCPECDEEIPDEDAENLDDVRCPKCGYQLTQEDLEKAGQIDGLIELDLASDGELDGDLFDFHPDSPFAFWLISRNRDYGSRAGLAVENLMSLCERNRFDSI